MAKKNEVQLHPASPYEAFKNTVYRHGVAELARLLGMKPGTLYNKADAADDSHHQPTVRDLILVTQLTGEFDALDAIEEMFGRAAYDVRHLSGHSDEALLELLARHGEENGEFYKALHTGLKERRFSRERLNHIRAEAFDSVSALMTLLSRLEGLVDD
ncbi:MAG: phage regulatory CII family protein [Hylemonella sp.]|uniref:phage regulatory CII family protein n=1 Tax=Hylemonella sp. TaxID=2066020 RepID=UPI00391C1FB6